GQDNNSLRVDKANVVTGSDTDADLIGRRVSLFQNLHLWIGVTNDNDLVHVNKRNLALRHLVGNNYRDAVQCVARSLGDVRLDNVLAVTVLDLTQGDEISRVNEPTIRGDFGNRCQANTIEQGVRVRQVKNAGLNVCLVQDAGRGYASTVRCTVTNQQGIVKGGAHIGHDALLQHLGYAHGCRTNQFVGYAGNSL